jgi:hypothetical protein
MELRSVTTTKLAFGLAELSSATGLSLGLLRKEISRGALRVRRIGRRRVVVLHEDWVHYLEREGGAGEAPKETAQKRTLCP